MMYQRKPQLKNSFWSPISAIKIHFWSPIYSASKSNNKTKGYCFEKDLNSMATLGGVSDSTSSSQNSAEIDDLARFAVEEHNKKENALLEFTKVVKAKEQVVAGTMYHLTLEVIDAGKKKVYEAKVWVKPWLNFKELQEFKPAGDSD